MAGAKYKAHDLDVELVFDRFLDEDALDRAAVLARVGQGAPDDAPGGALQIGVVGHHQELRRRGLDAHSLAGGIAAWHAIGAPTVPLVTAEGRPTP